MGAAGALAFTAVRARATGSLQFVAGDAVVVELTKARVASRSASSAPKNSVKPTTTPVIDAQSKNSVAGKAVHRCHFRQKAVLKNHSRGKCRPRGRRADRCCRKETRA